MKKIFIVLFSWLLALNGVSVAHVCASFSLCSQSAILICGLVVQAEDLTLTGGVTFDWLDITQEMRDARIQNYSTAVFGDNGLSAYQKTDYKQFSKDPNRVTNYMILENGGTESKDADLCAFRLPNKEFIYMYAIQYKNNPQNVYYYDALGKLKYVDMRSDNYPNFPYVSKQYRVSGKLVSAIYFASKDMQYMYEPDQSFKGIWFKDKMFDRTGKETLTRTNW